MDIRHLPLEHPGTYKEIRHLVIEATLPGLEAVARSALNELQPPLPPLPPKPPRGEVPRDAMGETAHQMALAARKAAMAARKDVLAPRALKLATLLKQEQGHLALEALNTLTPRQQALAVEAPRPASRRQKRLTDNDDSAETRWDLVLWLLDGLLSRDFPNKEVAPAARADAPFYLYRLAQKLAESTQWQTRHAARGLQEVLYELSAEHTRQKLQAHYGLGGDDSINHITKVLRPVDRHQNGALHLLSNRISLPAPASLVVGEPYQQQEFCIRQAIERWNVLVPWLMNWTEHLPLIKHALAGHPALADVVSDEEIGSALSTCKDIYLKTPKATAHKLAQVLQQLADLRRLGGSPAVHVEVVALLERIEAGVIEGEGGSSGVMKDASGGGSPTSAPSPLRAVFAGLDHVVEPFQRVGVMLRLLKRIAEKSDRLKLASDLVAEWRLPQAFGQSLFDRLGVKPGIAGLTDVVLARAAGILPAAFAERVGEALMAFDARAALASHASAKPFGALEKVPNVCVRAGAALRLLARLSDDSDRAKLASGLLEKWSDQRALDGGLFAYLGLKPGLEALTDDLLAWGCDLSVEEFVKMVDRAVASFDADNVAAGKPRRSGN